MWKKIKKLTRKKRGKVEECVSDNLGIKYRPSISLSSSATKLSIHSAVEDDDHTKDLMAEVLLDITHDMTTELTATLNGVGGKLKEDLEGKLKEINDRVTKIESSLRLNSTIIELTNNGCSKCCGD